MFIKPFMCNAAINKYSKLVFKGAKILELGSGYSTSWLEDLGAIVESYEHNEDWIKIVNPMLKTDNVNVHYHVSYEEAISTYPEEHFDIIIVDGINRLECMKEIYNSNVLKIGGYLLYDDCERRFINNDYKIACDLYSDWECEFISDYPFNNFEEYKSYEGKVQPHLLKQTLFAKRLE
tara:strand:- start:15845 stop:16378 length:534 start_codon:yes stop_codon:yes gene_type:complete